MGQYLNPGNDMFREVVQDYIYVDKTMLIRETNQKIGKYSSKYMCVSRPRRFGKSITAAMLAAYYSKDCDSRALFAPFHISKDESFEQHLNHYDVIYLNVQHFLSSREKRNTFIADIQEKVKNELYKKFAVSENDKKQTLAETLAYIYEKEIGDNKGFIFILDEWDCVFREAKGDQAAQKAYLDFLRDLFKDRSYVKLVYMTGILPIKKYGTHSAINIFREFSMTNPGELAPYVGFTETEVKALCDRFSMDYEEIRNWYDGYHFSKQAEVYNPKSVVDALLNGELDDYWTQTETYEALKIYIDMNYDGLKDAVMQMLGGEEVSVDIRTSQNDMTTFASRDDVLTLLIHLGYLGYNRSTESVFIPNEEIRAEFLTSVKNSHWKEVMTAIQLSEELLQATWNRDEAAVAEALEQAHESVSSVLKYHDENSLSCAIAVAYYSAQNYYRRPVREMPAGKGFADVIFLPKPNINKPALVIELKWNRTAEGALQQIKEKKYVKAIEDYTGEILMVGINYDKNEKRHECCIERWEKEAHG